jgi:tRNA nucleotidyltransferase/poly(A) polymerase
MNPLLYSRAIPPHTRVGRFVADEPRLSWLFKFLHRVPRAEAYLVGGTVRDASKGRIPKGIHVLVRNVPLEDLATVLNKLGVASAQNPYTLHFLPSDFPSEDPIEVTIPFDGRAEPYAPITFDLAGRDFTINAMAYSLNSGLVIDPYGGQRDLEQRCLRCVGQADKRMRERPRRALRALRLASEHHYQIADSTWQALKTTLPRLNHVTTHEDGSAIFVVPRANIGHEFLRTLSGHPGYGSKLWHDSGASDIFTPELSQLDQLVSQNGGTARQQSERALIEIGHPLPTLVFATLLAHLEDTAIEAAEKIILRLHLHTAHPHFNYQQALWLLKHKNVLEEADPKHMPTSAFEKIFGQDRGQHLLGFLHLLHRSSGQYTKTRARLHDATERRQQLVTDITKPKLIRGRDLETLGLTPGPRYRFILEKLRDAQLDGHIDNREEALNYARNLLAAQIY